MPVLEAILYLLTLERLSNPTGKHQSIVRSMRADDTVVSTSSLRLEVGNAQSIMNLTLMLSRASTSCAEKRHLAAS